MARRPSPGNISSPYGWRIHPISKVRTLHTGEDIGWAAGLTLVMPISGRITAYSFSAGYGWRVTIDDGKGTVIWLCHTARLLGVVGGWYDEGTPIAVMGSTGNSTGVHVHWEVFRNGVRLNPADWLTSVAAEDVVIIEPEKKRRRKMEVGYVTAPGRGAYVVRLIDGKIRGILGLELAAAKSIGIEPVPVEAAQIDYQATTFGTF